MKVGRQRGLTAHNIIILRHCKTVLCTLVEDVLEVQDCTLRLCKANSYLAIGHAYTQRLNPFTEFSHNFKCMHYRTKFFDRF